MTQKKNRKLPESAGRCNICADCVYPIADCPWLSKGVPVNGWDATETAVKHYGHGLKITKAYKINGCPLFIPHPRSGKYMGGKHGKRSP